jgi:hypothetical protein
MNCKKGDIAIVVRAPGCPEYLGKIVTCVRLIMPGALCFNRSDAIGAITQPTWATDFIERGIPVGFWDSVLRPINGLPEKEDTKEELTA